MQTAPPSHPAHQHAFQASSPDSSALAPSLVVSIHDLSTVTRGAVTRMLADLGDVGVPVTSLLVIPDHHHTGRIDADPDFGAWLRGRVAEGHEAVLHGFYHLRPSKAGEGVVTKLITRSYTAGEGEFHDLTFDEASALLQKGRASLHACGIKPTGFIAPAWLLGEEAEKAVRNEGFDYTTRLGSVIDCRERGEFAARSMVYSVRAPWRRGLSLLWNGVLFRTLRMGEAPLLRIGLHPPDWEHQAIRRQILKFIRIAARERSVATYQDWLARAHSDSPSGSS